MGAPRVPTPTIRVWMDDGAYHESQVLNADLVAWDRTRAKHRWPMPADAPMLWLTFLAWHNLTKTRHLMPAMTLAEFEEHCEAVASGDDDDEGEVDAPGVGDPTLTDPGPD
jgi:hypothetical protein